MQNKYCAFTRNSVDAPEITFRNFCRHWSLKLLGKVKKYTGEKNNATVKFENVKPTF